MQNLDVDLNKDISNSTEGYEDAESEPEWNNPTTSIDLYGIASAAGRLAGNLNTRPGALDDFFNKLKLLEHEWYEAERKYKNLQIENDKIFTQLESEKTKSSMLNKKLKFIQDNHKNFERLKQVYMNMKYQESTGRSMVEIREKYSQTIEVPPLDVSEIVSNLSRDSLISVKKSELSEAQDNLKALKEMVKKREESWSVNMKRERTFKDHIGILQHENEMLNQLMKVKDMEIKAMRITEEMNSRAKEEIEDYKMIITKMDKRLRELEKIGRIGRYTVIFTDKERSVLQGIIEKNPVTCKPMSRPQSRGLSPARGAINRTASMPVPRQPPKTPVKVTQSQAKDKNADCPKKESLSQVQEIEFLSRVKKEIERKQANLKVKVQEMIDSANIPTES